MCSTLPNSCPSRSIYLNFLGVASLISCACLCGVALYGYYAECDPLREGAIGKTDQLMPYFVMRELAQYPGVAGLFVSCVFSASLSTMSSGFNALATVTYGDFLSKTRWMAGLSEKRVQLLSKAIALSYGLAAIGMAFVVSQIDSILEAAISIAGALIGPMFGLFLLGILAPIANSTGVLCGLFAGEFFGLWVLVGSMLYPKRPQMLSTSIDQCPSSNATILTSSAMLSREREGMEHLYHIAYLLVPVFGCLISIVVGLIGSVLSGGPSKAARVRPEYLSSYAWCIWPRKWLPNRANMLSAVAATVDGRRESKGLVVDEKSPIKVEPSSFVYMVNGPSAEQQRADVWPEAARRKARRFTKQNAFEFDDREFERLDGGAQHMPVVGLKYSSHSEGSTSSSNSTDSGPATAQLVPSSNASRSVSSTTLASSSPSPVPSNESLLNQSKA